MLDQSVNLSVKLTHNFLFHQWFPYLRTNSSKQRAKNQCAVLSFLEQFLSSSTVVAVAKANVLQMPTIAVFGRNWSGADPNFAPFRWRIWSALRVHFFISQSECYVCYSFLHQIAFFSALNYLFSAPCYLKTAFLLANHNREIFSCILLIPKCTRKIMWLLINNIHEKHNYNNEFCQRARF